VALSGCPGSLARRARRAGRCVAPGLFGWLAPDGAAVWAPGGGRRVRASPQPFPPGGLRRRDALARLSRSDGAHRASASPLAARLALVLAMLAVTFVVHVPLGRSIRPAAARRRPPAGAVGRRRPAARRNSECSTLVDACCCFNVARRSRAAGLGNAASRRPTMSYRITLFPGRPSVPRGDRPAVLRIIAAAVWTSTGASRRRHFRPQGVNGVDVAEAVCSIRSFPQPAWRSRGPVTTPVGDGFTSVNVWPAQGASTSTPNLRPVQNLAGVRTRFDGGRPRHSPPRNTRGISTPDLEHVVVPGWSRVFKDHLVSAPRTAFRRTFALPGTQLSTGGRRITACTKANIS